MDDGSNEGAEIARLEGHDHSVKCIWGDVTNAVNSHGYEAVWFPAPHGRSELLWAKIGKPGEFRVLTVPVWVYGISVGTLIAAYESPTHGLAYRDLLEPSPGATIRVMTMEQASMDASQLYLDTVGVALAAAGVSVGPASFFDPAIVAFHVKNRARIETARELLNQFEEQGVIDTWELADPEADASDADEIWDLAASERSSPLTHDFPGTSRDRLWTFNYD